MLERRETFSRILAEALEFELHTCSTIYNIVSNFSFSSVIKEFSKFALQAQPLKEG
jgi:23S rRNA G2445 N2-methylase RlmL